MLSTLLTDIHMLCRKGKGPNFDVVHSKFLWQIKISMYISEVGILNSQLCGLQQSRIIQVRCHWKENFVSLFVPDLNNLIKTKIFFLTNCQCEQKSQSSSYPFPTVLYLNIWA